MNKTEFIKELIKVTNYSEEKCVKINNILEDTFLIGKKNKEKMIERFVNEIDLSNNEAEELYNKCMNILKNSLKEKLKHPFN